MAHLAAPQLVLLEESDRARLPDLVPLRMARAHARSGDAAAISGHLGTGDRFDRTVADFSEAYADPTEADDAAFVRAPGSAPGNGGTGGVTNQRKGDGR